MIKLSKKDGRNENKLHFLFDQETGDHHFICPSGLVGIISSENRLIIPL